MLERLAGEMMALVGVGVVVVVVGDGVVDGESGVYCVLRLLLRGQVVRRVHRALRVLCPSSEPANGGQQFREVLKIGIHRTWTLLRRCSRSELAPVRSFCSLRFLSMSAEIAVLKARITLSTCLHVISAVFCVGFSRNAAGGCG